MTSKMPTTVARKLGHELYEYGLVSLYLWVCFGALNLYQEAILNAHGVSYASFGWGAINALILAKFILIGEALHIGDRYATRRFIYVVAVKSSLLLLFLFVLTVVEHTIVGLIHGQSLTMAFATLGGGALPQILATCFVMLLILIPYVAFRELNEVLGEGGLRKLLLEPRAGLRSGNRQE
jgi:hypothetical protein